MRVRGSWLRVLRITADTALMVGAMPGWGSRSRLSGCGTRALVGWFSVSVFEYRDQGFRWTPCWWSEQRRARPRGVPRGGPRDEASLLPARGGRKKVVRCLSFWPLGPLFFGHNFTGLTLQPGPGSRAWPVKFSLLLVPQLRSGPKGERRQES